jgi:hypothetical protein
VEPQSVHFPPASNALAVVLNLNGRSAPVGGLCSRGLFLSTRVTNSSAQPVQLQQIQVRFESTTDGCRAHAAPIDSSLPAVLGPAALLEPGRETEARVFNAAGTLCEQPYGHPGCSWRATAQVGSDLGSAVASLDFATSPETQSPSRYCTGVAPPRILAPRSGATVSGTLDVSASLATTSACVNSARSVVTAFTDTGVIVARSPQLDLEVWHWDTTRHPNGRYRLRAESNCCGDLGDAIEVNVRN